MADGRPGRGLVGLAASQPARRGDDGRGNGASRLPRACLFIRFDCSRPGLPTHTCILARARLAAPRPPIGRRARFAHAACTGARPWPRHADCPSAVARPSAGALAAAPRLTRRLLRLSSAARALRSLPWLCPARSASTHDGAAVRRWSLGGSASPHRATAGPPPHPARRGTASRRRSAGQVMASHGRSLSRASAAFSWPVRVLGAWI